MQRFLKLLYLKWQVGPHIKSIAHAPASHDSCYLEGPESCGSEPEVTRQRNIPTSDDKNIPAGLW